MPEAYEGGTWIDKYIYQDDQGFWFVDETEQLNGPYKTTKEATDALNKYIAEYL